MTKTNFALLTASCYFSQICANSSQKGIFRFIFVSFEWIWGILMLIFMHFILYANFAVAESTLVLIHTLFACVQTTICNSFSEQRLIRRLFGHLIFEFELNAINRVYWRLKPCAKISLHLLCKSWSSFFDISSIWFIRNFNSCNSFLSSFSSTSVSCFLFLRQNVSVILLLLSFG